MTIRAKFQFRRGTAAEWVTKNPVLDEGEPGVEEDTKKIKIGDGETAWNDLAYIVTDITNLDFLAQELQDLEDEVVIEILETLEPPIDLILLLNNALAGGQ